MPEINHSYNCGVLTISDRGSRQERADTSGPALGKILGRHGFSLSATSMVPDEIAEIQRVIIDWVDQEGIDLVITTGGTGLSPRDITPEATRPILDYEIPGISEAMRMENISKTIKAILSRGLAGARKKSIIINLPGSEKAATENLLVVINALPHALYKLKGGQKDCGRS
ncbi:MAG: MogA/MoaB family molybdenum cofactor biosynthesis protein [Thermodesulfobacteriota bacterium]